MVSFISGVSPNLCQIFVRLPLHVFYYFLETTHSGFYDSDLTKAKYASPRELQAAIEALRQALPKPHCVELDPESLKTYGSSANTYYPSIPHSVIVRPESTEDVVRTVEISRKYKVPIIPYSGGTSLEGHFFGVSRCYIHFPLVFSLFAAELCII